jgi:hypothetical protein
MMQAMPMGMKIQIWDRATRASPKSAARKNPRYARELHFAGNSQSLPDQAHRPDPLGVGAADSVGIVVGVVDRYL